MKISLIALLIFLAGAIFNLPDSPSPSLFEQSVFIDDVPFTSQAPLGNWSDPVFQEGCEEASILMALRWARGEDLSQAEAVKEIESISRFELERYGSFIDRSAKDTAQLFRDYFQSENVSYFEEVKMADILTQLNHGNLVIVPMAGRKLGNPFYTPPGPDKHMLVVVGYDAKTGEIITNDPGTRHGLNFRYPLDIFESAIRDYPTGNHLPVTAIEKNMIVIARDN